MAAGEMQLTFNSTVSLTAASFAFGNFTTYGTSWDVTGTSDADDLSASGTDTALAMGAGNDTCISVEVSPPGDCDQSS
jgi:hypothetical protein